ncbi:MULTISPECIES: L-carnitine CoA-transferase [Ferrimonas]|uniref:L-carnitine CoA-transferase n=1 Tax=Ferrimonas TaxID=44011 RepID=UPI0003FB81E6|nr:MULTISPECIES: L-carnitine CoA-transferase [Ferrimonas]USD38485.1 L-carnitine CoA-transferase [Ferrimonas sp. SCSIO 43195]
MTDKIETPKFGPLTGVRVVFSAMEIAGPFPAQMMAEWGAEVIWIENVAYADTIRVQEFYSQFSRRNLHSLCLNIFSDDGKAAFLKLIETADVFIESSKGPAFSRRGITDDLLWQHNPALVIAHLSGYGQWGEDKYINLPSYDHIAGAFSGFLIQNGEKDQPIPPFPYTGDYISGMTVLSSVLAALYNAKATGKGESIDVAMYEALLRVGQYYMVDYFNNGKLYPRSTRGKDPTQVGCGVYKCNDGYIVMDLVGWKQIQGMLTVMGEDHLLGSDDYPEGIQGIRADSPAADYLEEKLDQFFAGRSIEECEALFAELVVAGTRVLTIPELESHPHYVARNNFIEWQTQDGDTVKGLNVTPKFKNNPGKVWRPMPKRGMDSRSIMSELGYSDSDIASLIEQGLLKTDDQ